MGKEEKKKVTVINREKTQTLIKSKSKVFDSFFSIYYSGAHLMMCNATLVLIYVVSSKIAVGFLRTAARLIDLSDLVMSIIEQFISD